MILKNKKNVAFTLAEGGRRPLFNSGVRRAAFTLVEVLITLAVIGVVAALTIPSLIENHNAKAWATAKNLTEKKLIEATRRMNIDGVMTGYSTTEDFLDTFKKYIKVIKSCNNSDINSCYSPKVVSTGQDGEIEVETAGLKTANDLGLKDFGTRTMSIVIADGTTMIMAYNPNCPEVDPFSQEAQAGQTSCMGIVMDVNGKKGPNRVGKDIKLSEGVAFSTCDNPIGDKCWSTDFVAQTPINTCDGTNEYDKNYTSEVSSGCSTNYWAGAKKTCADNGMELPTPDQLTELASVIYGTEIKRDTDYDVAIKDEYRNTITLGNSYWSSEQRPGYKYYAYIQSLSYYRTNPNWGNKDNGYLQAICVAK